MTRMNSSWTRRIRLDRRWLALAALGASLALGACAPEEGDGAAEDAQSDALLNLTAVAGGEAPVSATPSGREPSSG